MQTWFSRNLPALTETEQKLLQTKKVAVIGLGGLGGYLVELLARLGVGEITGVDPDRMEESNRNRQLLCTAQTLGRSKAEAAKKRAEQIAPGIVFHAVDEALCNENADVILDGQDLVLDALDTIASRLLLEDACAQHRIPLIHGAVEGWQAELAVILPGDGLLHRLYAEPRAGGKSSLSFTCSLCASLQAAEAAKLLCGRETALAGKLLVADLLQTEFQIFPI